VGAGGITFLAPIAAGFHPFPSRTRQLRPPAPMVVRPQGPSRVGQRQIITMSPSRDNAGGRSSMQRHVATLPSCGQGRLRGFPDSF